MLIEYAFDLGVDLGPWVTALILQLHPDLAPELIVFREYRYNGYLKSLNTSS